MKKKGLCIAAVFFLVSWMIFLMPEALHSAVSSHADPRNLPKGCASCHTGHGVLNTPMLPDDKETFCYRCHGPLSRVETAKGDRILGRDVEVVDIQREFEKPYGHYVENKGVHRYDEILPETDPSAPRHVECGDCHHHHLVSAENRMAGVSGIAVDGSTVPEVSKEYELCFKCHSKSANLPGDQTDKAEVFDISSQSYHPVMAPGRNFDVPSLSFPLTPSSMIKCTDCHNNEDALGPRGPHGSRYEHILARNYYDNDGPEGPSRYALCYGCHRRESILGNESFPYHREHVSVLSVSCRTCHNSHGSLMNSHLIDFDNISIRPSGSGILEFIDFGEKAGQCFLTCHGKDHDPATYPGEPFLPSLESTP